MTMVSVDAAQARLLALAERLPARLIPIASAAGCWAAEPILARRNQPGLDLSAMDGWAIRFGERPGPWRVAGESAAGGGLGRALAAGETARIFTGAPMPAGADTVLIQEEAAREGDLVRMTGEGPPHAGAHVRPSGSDFRAGTPLVEAGARLTPAQIALAALGGYGQLTVGGRPRVTLISTGDELVAPGAPAEGALLPASNSVMLVAQLSGLPASVVDGGIVPDRLETIAEAFATAAQSADVIVTTGGVSVGDHDLVRPALERAGASLGFWRVALKPGKPLMAGKLGRAVVLGLPGNPVSAFVTAELFLKPLIRQLAGAADPLPVLQEGVLGAPLPATGSRAEYLRARRCDGRLVEVASQDSAAVRALAAADLLVVRPPHAPALAAGEIVPVLPLDGR